MCEATAIKQEFSSEQLPEPVLIILSPPPPFLPGLGPPAISWHKWLKAFEHYLDVLDEDQLSDSAKCALLQNCLGAEGRRIFSTLIRSETAFASAISALSVYFSADPASQTARLEFHHRAQTPAETVEQFASALKDLLKPCNYGDLQDKLILDQLIEKTHHPQLRERLLREGESLTLEEALALGREVECALNASELSGTVHEVSVDIGDDLDPPVQKKARRGRPRRGEIRAKAKTKPRSTKTLVRSARVRENNCYTNDKLDCGDEDNEDDEDGDAACKRTEEEDSNETSDDDDEDEGDQDSKHKGPRCPICMGKRYRDAHKLVRHMRTHTKEKPFSCPQCPVTFSQSYHMTRHLRNQHGAGQHTCSTCGESLGSLAELRSHRRTHTSKLLSCPVCKETFTDNGEFCGHVQSHGNEKSIRATGESPRGTDKKETIKLRCRDNRESDADSGDRDSQDKGAGVSVKIEKKDSDEAKIKDKSSKNKTSTSKIKTKGHFCPICVGRRFRGPDKLARHMRTHTKEKPFSCPICALTFSQPYHMTRHLRNQHSLGKYICEKCGKSVGSWLELKAHKKTHAVEGLTCLACDKQFEEKSALASHLKLHKKVQASPQSLICGDCGKVFGRMYHLKRHIVTHRKASNAETYTCPDCQKTYAFPEDLNKHLEVHVKENNGTCPKCNETFSSPEELESHMGVHQKSYTCDTCGRKFKVEYALKKHEQGHKDAQYYCQLCRKHFIKMSHYKRHIMVHDRRESRCPHCDSVFLQLTALKYHLRTHTEERPYQCTCCIETFEEEEELEQHRLKHRKFKKEKPYSCTRCDCAFSALLELTEHMILHEGEQPLNCPDCGKTFLNKNKLEKHLSIHTGERPHLCSICGNGFPSAASLKLHVHIHTGEKPFQCSQCSKSFRSNSGLRLHSRQHMEVRPSYACPECGRTYGRMTELKMHQRYHTGDKPYVCTCCNKRFISKDKLNVHMRIHTGERPYSCPHCGQTFTQTGDRNRHISKYH